MELMVAIAMPCTRRVGVRGEFVSIDASFRRGAMRRTRSQPSVSMRERHRRSINRAHIAMRLSKYNRVNMSRLTSSLLGTNESLHSVMGPRGAERVSTMSTQSVSHQREPSTRRQTALAAKLLAAASSALLLQLHDDVLGRILTFLEAKDLAKLETVCFNFRYASWNTESGVPSLPESSAKRKLESAQLQDMPPNFKYVNVTNEAPFQSRIHLSPHRDARAMDPASRSPSSVAAASRIADAVRIP